MKIGEWITIFEALEKQGATEDSELKFFSQAGVPYELVRLAGGIPDIQKETVTVPNPEDKRKKVEKNIFKMRIK